MRRRASRVAHEVKCDKKTRQCDKCRKWFTNEPYAIKWTHSASGILSLEWRCWRCWHTWEIIHLFLEKYPKLFVYAKRGRWYYLKLFSDQFHFPSSDGEFDPDW